MLITSKNTFYGDKSEKTVSDPNGDYILTKSEATKILQEIKNNPWVDAAKKTELQEAYDSLYNIVLVDGARNYNGDISKMAKEGKNFKVAVGEWEYKIESAGEVFDQHIRDIAPSYEAMFGYDGRIFIKKEDRVFEIRERPSASDKHWDNLYAWFF